MEKNNTRRSAHLRWLSWRRRSRPGRRRSLRRESSSRTRFRSANNHPECAAPRDTAARWHTGSGHVDCPPGSWTRSRRRPRRPRRRLDSNQHSLVHNAMSRDRLQRIAALIQRSAIRTAHAGEIPVGEGGQQTLAEFIIGADVVGNNTANCDWS